jgi:hypothetical protein
MGPKAKSAVPVLRDFAEHDPDVRVRTWAAKVLERLESR